MSVLYTPAERPFSGIHLDVRIVQRGLAWYASRGVYVMSGPGPIDGVWGPRTEASYRSWVHGIAASQGHDPVRVLALLRPNPTTPVPDGFIAVPRELADLLAEASRQYVAPRTPTSSSPSTSTNIAPLPTPSGGGGWGVLLGLGAAAVIVGGVVWWASRD